MNGLFELDITFISYQKGNKVRGSYFPFIMAIRPTGLISTGRTAP